MNFLGKLYLGVEQEQRIHVGSCIKKVAGNQVWIRVYPTQTGKHPHYFPLCLQVYADMNWAAVFRALSPQKLNEHKENDTVNMKLIGAGIPGRVPRTYCLTWPGRVFIPS